jgi:hypothetical protein
MIVPNRHLSRPQSHTFAYDEIDKSEGWVLEKTPAGISTCGPSPLEETEKKNKNPGNDPR